MLLDLERLGLSASYYSPAMHAARRRLAARLGYSSSDQTTETVTVDLGALLGPYSEAVARAA